MATTRCQWTLDQFPAYKAGRLDREQSDQLFAHLMYCEACRRALWQPEVDRFRESLKGGAWLAQQAVAFRAERWGHVPMALAASVRGQGGRVGHARGLALLGDGRNERVDVFCHATLVGGSPGRMKVRLPPALKLGGVSDPFRPVEEALLSLLPSNLPPVAVEVALDAGGPLPRQLLLAGDSLHLPVAIAAASAWLDLAVRTDRVFTGALRGDGLLLEVGDLDEKLYLLPSGVRLVVPARNRVPSAHRGQVLSATDLAQALDHAGAVMPTGGVLSLAAAGVEPEVAAVRATLERIPGGAVILAFPEPNPTQAPLWYIGGRAGLVALRPGAGADVAAETLAAVRGAAEHLRTVGALARDRVPFPLRGFGLAPAGAPEGDVASLAAAVWMDPGQLAPRLMTPVPGRGFLPFATAQAMARALWTWGGGSEAAWEHAQPSEPPIVVRGPELKLGKTLRKVRPGADVQPDERQTARWCDPDLALSLKELPRHLFMVGSLDGGAGDLARVLTEAAVRAQIPALVLDLAGGLSSLAVPATRAGLEAVGKRLPGVETWLEGRVREHKPWPGEAPTDVGPVPVRISFTASTELPAEGWRPEAWVVDAHRRDASEQRHLLEAWAERLGRVPDSTVHPGRPNVLLVVNAGTHLAPDAPARTRRAVEGLLKAGPQVGVAVALLVRAPVDLDPGLASLCHAGFVGSPGAAGSWPGLHPSWEPLAAHLSHLAEGELLFRSPDQTAVVVPRLPASLPLPEPPMDLLERFAVGVDGVQEAPASQMTVLPDLAREEDTLVEAGVLLPKVPWQQHVAGYRVALGSRGEVGGSVDHLVGELQVVREGREYRVTLEARRDGLRLDGAQMAAGKRVSLGDRHRIEVGGRSLGYTFCARRSDPAGWPYVAEISGIDGRSWALQGEPLRIGRDRSRCQVSFPDRQTQADLLWRHGTEGPAGTEGLTLDAIYASGLHGEIEHTDAGPSLVNRSSRTDVYLRRGGLLQTIHAGGGAARLEPGDDVLIGQRVLRWERG